tara:strand:- start:4656 stop:4898 length:243 start_codon:yes stop_codon:yes gene_type:complete
MSDIVRLPSDEDERRRVEQAIAQGAGITIADFAERILGEPVDKEFVESLKSRLERAGSNEEPFDLKEEIEKLWKWRQEMA